MCSFLYGNMTLKFAKRCAGPNYDVFLEVWHVYAGTKDINKKVMHQVQKQKKKQNIVFVPNIMDLSDYEVSGVSKLNLDLI